jgi:hypothetical protein
VTHVYIKIKHEINYNTGLVIIIMSVSLKCFLFRITGFRAIYNFCTVHSETQRQDGYPYYLTIGPYCPAFPPYHLKDT